MVALLPCLPPFPPLSLSTQYGGSSPCGSEHQSCWFRLFPIVATQPTCSAGQYLKGAKVNVKGWCGACSNAQCNDGKYRAGACAGSSDGYTCQRCSNAQCNEGKYRAGTCAGVSDGYACKPCENTACPFTAGMKQFRTGSCAGANNGCGHRTRLARAHAQHATLGFPRGAHD